MSINMSGGHVDIPEIATAYVRTINTLVSRTGALLSAGNTQQGISLEHRLEWSLHDIGFWAAYFDKSQSGTRYFYVLEHVKPKDTSALAEGWRRAWLMAHRQGDPEKWGGWPPEDSRYKSE